MMLLSIVSALAILCLGILTSITDIRYHKAKNKHIFPFACAGVILQMISVLRAPQSAALIFENLALAAAVSVGFYAAKIWAAGDAKLFFAMTLLLPRDLTGNAFAASFSTLFVLGITFSVAMLYVVIESTVLLAKGKKDYKPLQPSSLFVRPSKEAVLSWITAYFVIDTADNLLKLQDAAVINDSYLMVLLHMLFANAVLSLIRTNRRKAIASGVLILLRSALALMHLMPFFELSIPSLLIIAAVMLLLRFTARYDYRAIPTASVEEGQVLAQSTVAWFLMSKAKGLPSYTDESTRYRLSPEEAAAVREWGRAKEGRDTVVVVRNIPFAPFIFAGTLLFLSYCFYLRF